MNYDVITGKKDLGFTFSIISGDPDANSNTCPQNLMEQILQTLMQVLTLLSGKLNTMPSNSQFLLKPVD